MLGVYLIGLVMAVHPVMTEIEVQVHQREMTSQHQRLTNDPLKYPHPSPAAEPCATVTDIHVGSHPLSGPIKAHSTIVVYTNQLKGEAQVM